MILKPELNLVFFIGEIMTAPYINGSRQIGDFEYQKFREDNTGKPAVAVVNADGTNINNGVATSAKQDSQITQLANILIELTQKTEATQNQQVELINAIRLVLQSIANPAYVDKSANQMRSQVTGSLTAVTTVTTVTNLTNIGSFPADHLQLMNNRTAWATSVRQIIV